MYGVAANCVKCKLLSSQVFLNSKKERMCGDCIQKEYDFASTELEKVAEKNKQLEHRVALYDAILEQIKNFTHLAKKE